MSAPVIRQAVSEDYPAIQEFLRSEWSAEHVFVKKPELFRWQHLDQVSQKLTYILFEVDGEIQSLIGYIPYRHWSPTAPENRVFLAIWKTSDNCTVAGAGFHIFRQIRDIAKTDFVGAIGVSAIALPIYKRLGYVTGLMDHTVIFNPNPPTKFLESTPAQEISRGEAQWLELSFDQDPAHIDEVCLENHSAKNAEYLQNRYANHPTYNYQLYSITLAEKEVLLVTRVIKVGDASIARIVDAVGDFSAIAMAAGALKDLVEQKQYNYIDLYSTGLEVEELAAGGYFVRTTESEHIVPNYFEPFVMANAELTFAWKNFGEPSKVVLFRGDSDQDRPNI